MNNIFIAFITLLVLVCCSETKSTHKNITDTPSDSIVYGNPDSLKDVCAKFHNERAVWNVYSNKGKDVLVRGDSTDFLRNGNASDFVSKFNSFYAGYQYSVKIQMDSINNKTIYISLINGEYFTQRIGTTGANWYTASLVFTFLEAKDIEKVHMNFQEGDAGGQPGFKDRDSIANFYAICYGKYPR